MQPQSIIIDSFPQDIILQLILERLNLINKSSQQFNHEFNQIQNELKIHEQQCKKQGLINELPFLMKQLELKHYDMCPKLKTAKISFTKRGRSDLKSIDKQKNPYHYSKFQDTLNKYSLSCSKQNQKLKWKTIKDDEKKQSVWTNRMTPRSSRIKKSSEQFQRIL